MRQLSPLLCLTLAACSWFSPDLPPVQQMPETKAESGTPPPALPAPAASDSLPQYDGAEATFEENLITVTVNDPLPAKSARLIAPDGTITLASAIDTTRDMAHESSGFGPNIGVGVAGGSSSGVSTGFGIGFPLFGDGESKTYSTTESRISFRLKDVADYRRNWQRYAIAVDLDDGVNKRTFQMLPPAPPAP